MSYPELTNEDHIGGYDDRHLKTREDDVETQAYGNGAPKKGLSRKTWIIIGIAALVVVVVAAVVGGVVGSRPGPSSAPSKSASSSVVSVNSTDVSTSRLPRTSAKSFYPEVITFTLSVPTVVATGTSVLLIPTVATLQPKLSTVTLSGNATDPVPSGSTQTLVATSTQVISVYDGTLATVLPAGVTAQASVHLVGPVSVLSTILPSSASTTPSSASSTTTDGIPSPSTDAAALSFPTPTSTTLLTNQFLSEVVDGSGATQTVVYQSGPSQGDPTSPVRTVLAPTVLRKGLRWGRRAPGVIQWRGGPLNRAPRAIP